MAIAELPLPSSTAETVLRLTDRLEDYLSFSRDKNVDEFGEYTPPKKTTVTLSKVPKYFVVAFRRIRSHLEKHPTGDSTDLYPGVESGLGWSLLVMHGISCLFNTGIPDAFRALMRRYEGTEFQMSGEDEMEFEAILKSFEFQPADRSHGSTRVSFKCPEDLTDLSSFCQQGGDCSKPGRNGVAIFDPESILRMQRSDILVPLAGKGLADFLCVLETSKGPCTVQPVNEDFRTWAEADYHRLLDRLQNRTKRLSKILGTY